MNKILFFNVVLGGSLADAISENYRNMRYFTEPELKDLLLQVARGLKYIHSMSLVHMDIKPSKCVNWFTLLTGSSVNLICREMSSWPHLFNCKFFTEALSSSTKISVIKLAGKIVTVDEFILGPFC